MSTRKCQTASEAVAVNNGHLYAAHEVFGLCIACAHVYARGGRPACDHRGNSGSISHLPRTLDEGGQFAGTGWLSHRPPGALVLGRPAEDICLGEVVRATEPAFAIVECFSTNNQCVASDCCRLARVLDQALTAFLTVLDQHTLASVALKPKDFRAVFPTISGHR